MQKSVFTLLAVLLIGTVTILPSCKKEKEASTQEKIVGKWTLDAAYFNYFFLGASQKDTITGSGTDYIQFNGDGTITGSGEGPVTGGTWSLVDNKLVIKETVDEEEQSFGYDIKKLTSNELQLYAKETEGEDYMEITLMLKK